MIMETLRALKTQSFHEKQNFRDHDYLG